MGCEIYVVSEPRELPRACVIASVTLRNLYLVRAEDDELPGTQVTEK